MKIGRDNLSGPAEAAAKAFSVVSGLLAEVRAAVADLCSRLQELDRVLAGQSGTARLLDRVETAARDVQDLVSDASARAAHDGVAKAVGLALSNLEEITSSARGIDAVASLTAVTSRSLSLTAFDDYVISLRRGVEAMRGDANHLSRAVAILESGRGKAVQLLGSANAHLTQVTTMLGEVAEQRAETEMLLQQSLQEVAGLALRLPPAAASEIEVLMRAIQFSDALSQRLDHIGMVLEFDQARPDETGPLARAQIEALVEETRDIAENSARGLQRIGQLAAEVGRIMGNDSNSPAGQALRMGRDMLARISEFTRSVLAAIEGAEGESKALFNSAAEAEKRFASVMVATSAMQILAINAALLARRGKEREAAAMNVLSVEVQHKVARCADAATACNLAIAQLSNPDDLAVFTAIGPAADAYRHSIGQTNAAISSAELAASDLQRMRGATFEALDRLSNALRIASEALKAIHSSAADLTVLANALPRDVGQDANPLLQLMEIYSMEAERSVHRKVFGLHGAATSATAMAQSDDDLLAAIMF